MVWITGASRGIGIFRCFFRYAENSAVSTPPPRNSHCRNCYLIVSGEVLAKQLASLGAKLILSARNEVELERVRQQLRGIVLNKKWFFLFPLSFGLMLFWYKMVVYFRA